MIAKISFVLLFLNLVQCFNILGIIPYPGKSHFMVFKVYFIELSKRGHNVTVISHFPLKNPLKNYHDISLINNSSLVEGNTSNKNWTLIQDAFFLATSSINNCDHMLANKEVQKLVSQKPKFDVIVVEHFNSDCALGIAYKLEAPVVGITSLILFPWQYARFGIPNNPSFVPLMFLGGGNKPSLYQKIERLIIKACFDFMHYYVSQYNNQKSLAKYFDDIPPLEELARDIKFVLVYQHFTLTKSRLLPSNVIEVGGYHVTEPKPLTGELKKFIEEAKSGVIYISFGTMLSSVKHETLETIVEAVQELPQRVILKSENRSVAIMNKLYVSKWLPQVDILGHKKVIAFVSHGGMGSTTEAIHFGVPIVAMPVFGDQPANAASIEEIGLGTQLQRKKLTKDNFVQALNMIMDRKFRERVKQVSAAWHDRPMPPLDTAIYWTEYAARHTNFTFRTPAADVPFYQYLLLDIIGVILVGLLTLFYLVKAIALLGFRIKEYCSEKKSRKNRKPKRE